MLLRADASPQIGTGHVLRCLALAQAWQDSGDRVVLLSSRMPEQLVGRMEAEGIYLRSLSGEAASIEDARETAELAATVRAAGVVVDGYGFGSRYQSELYGRVPCLVVIDDHGCLKGEYHADLILDPNPGAGAGPYRHRPPGSRLLLGAEFALLRREFRTQIIRSPSIPETARRILVTFGGGDQEESILSAMAALEKLQTEPEITVVVGPATTTSASVEVAARRSRHRVEVARNVQDMSLLMSACDLAIASAGSTALELACLGVPAILVPVAENQRHTATVMSEAGAAELAGCEGPFPDAELRSKLGALVAGLVRSPRRRAELSDRARRLVDGQGATRVATLIQSMGTPGRGVTRGAIGTSPTEVQAPRSPARSLALRAVEQSDCELVWRWANEPTVRVASFSSEPIPWRRHVAWFRAALADRDCHFYIARDDQGTPVGQIRFNVSGSQAVVSVSLDPACQARGLGTTLIREGTTRFFSERPDVQSIQAYIKRDNAPSLAAFSKAGYVMAGETTVKGQPAIRLASSRGSAA